MDDIRLVLYRWVGRHGLDANQHAQLLREAGLGQEPAGLQQRLIQGLAVLAAALAAFGLLMWLAANWDDLGRFGRFALLQGLVLLLALAAWLLPRLRAALGLALFLVLGGLFAYFGQTYQTGADPWQLFALWAALGLPLGLALRSDVLWAPWVLVLMAAIALWWQAEAPSIRLFNSHLPAQIRGLQLLHWALLALPLAFLGRPLRSWTGAGIWSWRLALLLAVGQMSVSALLLLFGGDETLLFSLALLLLAGAAFALARPAHIEIFGLSVLALALNVLLLAGLGRWLLEDHRVEPIASFALLTLVGAGLLSLSVKGLLAAARRQRESEQNDGTAA
ncbi:DUF2157 domain-containing protein [Roseateles sp. PN1]|uniref:DUF2157 domain-containing protein n=1 Tax=Roseateles sp. PN1 TaxID=3137372 RepID=UPI00313A07D1